ncbi:hypothetical protein BMW26_06575 [Microbacterium sp. 1.5R]|uniref:hypothetical protein n=1 Tax=Microbacterium sp. 1.5R TaxID=1916917 RepID=UPI00090A5C15|nr:hypothetical protein [Microbacterium sp. 1.5R]APH44659.1 hypothetical protein BMW26_06575 [Microbacterium sp. 1.5R]
MSELDELRERVVALERENDELRTPKKRRFRAKSVVGAILLVLAVVLAPVAAMGTWARLQLVDTERFVATFAPLASDPDVQDFVADQVTTAIDEQVDISAVVGEVFDGIRSLGLPPRADTAISLLEGPAANGAISLIDGVVRDVVRSDQFADIWTQSLRFTHERATAIIQNAPGTAVQLGDDGAVTIELGVVIDRVKEAMSERGIGLADVIPEIDRSIPIAQADALALVRTVYQVADIGGFWLPWLVLGLFVAGVLLMRDRPRALFWSSAGFALVFLLLTAGMGIGRGVFIRAVSPSIMSAAAATALFEQLTSLLAGTIAALALVGVLIAIWAWLAGSGRTAVAFRGLLESGFSAVRGAAEKRGLTTGAFGRGVDRSRGPIFLVGALAAMTLLIVTRPVSFGVVIGVGAGLLVLAILIELLRRPEGDADIAPVARDPRDEPVSEPLAERAPDAVS